MLSALKARLPLRGLVQRLAKRLGNEFDWPTLPVHGARGERLPRDSFIRRHFPDFIG